MPRPLPRPAPGVEIRVALAERYRALIGRHRQVVEWAGDRCPWPSMLAAIEAGGPVELSGWELPDGHRGGWASFDRVVVESDGTVRLARTPSLKSSPASAGHTEGAP